MGKFFSGKKITLTVISAGILTALIIADNFNYAAPETKISFSAAETECLKKIATEFDPILKGRAHQSDLIMNNSIAAYGIDKNKPALDVAMAEAELADKLETVKFNKAYCTKYAGCFPDQPFKTTFDSCYDVFSDQENDIDN